MSCSMSTVADFELFECVGSSGSDCSVVWFMCACACVCVCVQVKMTADGFEVSKANLTAVPCVEGGSCGGGPEGEGGACYTLHYPTWHARPWHATPH